MDVPKKVKFITVIINTKNFTNRIIIKIAIPNIKKMNSRISSILAFSKNKEAG